MARLAFAFALVLSFVATAAWLAGRETSAGGPTYGDASCDGLVNSIDAAVVLQFSAGLLPSLACPANADVNGDRSSNSLDSALILQYAAGLIGRLGPPFNTTPTVTPFTPTATPPPGGTTYPTIDYRPWIWWTNTGITLTAGQTINVAAFGAVIYDNFHLTGVSPDGDDTFKGWGNCHDHSLVGWVGASRPARDADPATLTNVICLGSQFNGTVPTGGTLYISINDRGGFNDTGGFSNNSGQWQVTITTYP